MSLVYVSDGIATIWDKEILLQEKQINERNMWCSSVKTVNVYSTSMFVITQSSCRSLLGV